MYFVTGDGMLHIINAADGTDLQPPYKFYGGKGWALNLVGNTLWMQTTYGGASIAAVRVDDPEHKVMTWNAGSGGAWGRRGVAVDSTGTAWTTTGDGVYDLTSDPPRYANSVVGVHIQNGQMKLKDYYTPTNWEWLRKRDLDPNNTPTVFKYKGRELVAASGKECRLYLLDPESAGGENHQTPAFKTPLFCNEEVDFQDMGSWGALSSWEDRGTRWVLAPFWGPVHSQAKFPLSYGPVKEGGVAAFKLVERAGKLEFAPAWVSRDMRRGEPVLIVNGMVVAYGSGEETKQAWPDIGLQFDSSIRAAKGTRAVIYVLDAITGKELWSSGEHDAPVQPLLRRHRRQRPHLSRNLRRHALLLRRRCRRRTASSQEPMETRTFAARLIRGAVVVACCAASGVAAQQAAPVNREQILEQHSKDEKGGSAEKGRPLFESRCAGCHRFGAIGKDVGPDLTTITSRFKKRDILESVLWPSKVMSDQYQAEMFELTDGKVVSGLIVRENATAVLVRTAENPDKPVVVSKAQISDRASSPVSLMPEGLFDDLDSTKIADLLAFVMAPPPDK